MVDDDGYHTPRFSEEEAAWLPPWLQPSQLPLSVDGRAKDDQCLRPTGCEISKYHQGNVGDGQVTDVIAKEDSRSFSCHLFLSGMESSSVFNAHSSGNVPHFHLHLSSEDISQIPSCEVGDWHKIGALKPNRESVPKLSLIQNEVDCGHTTMNGDHPANISTEGCSPVISWRPPAVLPTKGNQDNGKKNNEKVDGHLETTDIDDAVELSIAASEALVISELSSLVSQPDFFNTAALLDVALRLKQARNYHHVDVLEAVSSNPNDEHDETDQLHDLDDYIMADAFEDVGLPCNQIVTACNDSFNSKVSTTKSQNNFHNSKQGHFPYTDELCVPNTHLSEDHGFGAAQEDVPRSRDIVTSAIALEEKLSNASTTGSKFKQLSLQGCSFHCTEPYICCPLNMDTLDTSKVAIKSFQKNSNGPTSAENLSIEDRNIQDDEDVVHRDKKIRGEIPNFFHGETSFISESMDGQTDGNAIVITPEAEPKIITSSNSLFEDLCRIQDNENKISPDEDIVASSNLLEIDTLCSVVPCSLSDVPCSLSSDRTRVPPSHNQEGIGMEAECFLIPTTEQISVLNPEEYLPTAADAQRGNFVSSKLRDKGSTVARKQLSSLKKYSIVPVKTTYSSEKSFLLRESTPTVSINENKYCIMSSREETARILMNPVAKSQNINEQRHSWKNDASTEQILKHNATLNNDVSPMVHQHADTSAPIILNTGARRHLQACNTISPRKYEDDTTKISLLSKMEKRRKRSPSDEAHCRNKACVGAACSKCSSSHTHLLKEQCLRTKKVRFSEAEADIHYLPANLSEKQSWPTKKQGTSEAGYDIHGNDATHQMNCGCQTCSHTKTDRQIKDSKKPSKSRTRKSNYKYLTKDFSKDGKGRMLEGLEFLLTGFPTKKKGEIGTLIRRHGGLVLPDIPLPYSSMEDTDQHLPIVLSPKKMQTAKFLCGCAIKTWLLHDNWLSDSVQAGFMLPPAKYLTLPNQISERKHLRIGQPHLCNSGAIFDKVGVILFGKTSFCAKFFKVIKFGGGRVFKALHWLVQSLKNGKNTVGAIVVEDEINVSRHLKHCALEHDLYMMPASWITNSLFSGKLLPCKKDRTAPFHRIKKPRFPQPDPVDVCEET